MRQLGNDPRWKGAGEAEGCSVRLKKIHCLDPSQASVSSGPGSRSVLTFLSLIFHVSLRESKMLHSQIFVFKFSPKYEGDGHFPGAFQIL